MGYTLSNYSSEMKGLMTLLELFGIEFLAVCRNFLLPEAFEVRGRVDDLFLAERFQVVS
jgi:hypothetical protein